MLMDIYAFLCYNYFVNVRYVVGAVWILGSTITNLNNSTTQIGNPAILSSAVPARKEYLCDLSAD